MGDGLELVLPLGEAAETFQLEKAVCSHGLFMMAPNYWDPLSKTLLRPLRLLHSETQTETSVLVRVSQPQSDPHSLHVRVYGTHFLPHPHRQSLLVFYFELCFPFPIRIPSSRFCEMDVQAQVSRMLRLAETEERAVRGFRKMYIDGAEEERSFGGRVFRSPTLFEDMVKCILLCNCQWSRTLSMVRALCELQFELKNRSSSITFTETGGSVTESRNTKCKCPKAKMDDFVPKTPVGKETKIKPKSSKVSTKLKKPAEAREEFEANAHMRTDSVQTTVKNLNSNICTANVEDDSCQSCKRCQASGELTGSYLPTMLQYPEGQECQAYDMVGNFPSPSELAKLDESYLRTRCNLGYRASRILKLAQGIVEGRIQLTQLEEACKEASLSNYNKLADQLKKIDGFGPFTCANVLMCLGFYHVIPSDSETIRHLRQVHSRKSNSQTVQKDVEYIYGKYAPFQFLAYWSELWHFYEKSFGKLSEMPCSEYQLITASNMRSTRSRCKGKKIATGERPSISLDDEETKD